MSRLDQIIFIADYIEPRRDKAPNLPEVRRMAFLDLDECCYIILRDTLNFLKSKKAKIDSMTEEAYNFYNGIHCRKYPAVNHEDSSEG
jgi:HD superfamily phosphohydrolase YqeK